MAGVDALCILTEQYIILLGWQLPDPARLAAELKHASDQTQACLTIPEVNPTHVTVWNLKIGTATV